ncbi:MAG: monomethylamine:corrinoid methyltransferase, partial [Candidatus Ranarchaeia archaeon]
PLEMKSIMLRASMTREALRRAGRPGLACVTQSSSFCGIGSYNASWGFRKYDLQSDAIVPPLTLQDSFLAKLMYFTKLGIPLYLASVPLIGGFGGGPAGTALLAVAEQLAAMVLGASVVHFGAQHIIYGHQSNSQSLWTSLLVNHAVSRNSHIVHTTSIVPAARPGELQYFIEIAAQTIGAVISGSHVTGPRTALLAKPNQNTPLSARLMAEIAHATTKLSVANALEIVEAIYPLYKDKQKLADMKAGKGFESLYDLSTLEPTAPHMSQYEKAKSLLQDIGLPIKG